MEGVAIEAPLLSCSLVDATSVVAKLVCAGFMLTSSPSIDVEMIGWED
jgi:hypothetical protein